MKRIALLSAAFCTFSCATSGISGHLFASNPVVAHRGAFKKNGFPENSLASLREAIRLKCTGSEFDVRMSADDTLVINHDPHFQGMEIEKTTYQELSSVPLSNGETLPTLRQYLREGLRENNTTQLVVEIKPSGISKDRGRVVAEKVMNMVREIKAEKMVTYISFDYDILKKLEELDATAFTQYLNGDVAPDRIKADGIDGMDYHFSVFRKNPEWIAQAKQLGVSLNAWTVNERENMEWLLMQKFDFITTNEPELLLTIAKAENRSSGK